MTLRYWCHFLRYDTWEWEWQISSNSTASMHACCSTRAAMMFMEGGDIVPYVGHYLPNWLIIRQNYECWVLNKGRSNRQDRQAGHGRARGLKSVHDCSCFIKFGTISASHYAVSYQLQHRKKFGRLPLISVMNPLYKVQIDDPYGIRWFDAFV